MFEWFKKMSPHNKSKIISLISYLIFGTTIISGIYFMLSRSLLEEAEQRLVVYTDTSQVILKRHGANFSTREGKLYIGEHLLNDDVTTAKELADLLGINVSIYLDDLRVSSNMVENIGSRMAHNEVYDTVIKGGRSYSGENDVVGTTYLTAYDPLKNAAGETIGMIVSAIKKSDQVAVVRTLVFNIAIVTLILGWIMSEVQKRQTNAQRRAIMTDLADRFEQNIKGVVSTVSAAATEMQGSAKAMSAIAEETSHQSTAVSAAAEQSATNIQTVASAAEELNTSISEINLIRLKTHCASCRPASKSPKRLAPSCRTSITRRRTSAMLSNSSATSPRKSTCWRSMPPSKRHAREMQARRFAVVANEVKNLANQTGNATKEITKQITDIQGQPLSKQSQRSRNRETQDGNSSTAIASGSHRRAKLGNKGDFAQHSETAQGTSEVTKNIIGVTRAASETGTASTQVLETAGQLAQESETLRHVVENFLHEIRHG